MRCTQSIQWPVRFRGVAGIGLHACLRRELRLSYTSLLGNRLPALAELAIERAVLEEPQKRSNNSPPRRVKKEAKAACAGGICGGLPSNTSASSLPKASNCPLSCIPPRMVAMLSACPVQILARDSARCCRHSKAPSASRALLVFESGCQKLHGPLEAPLRRKPM